MIVCFLNDRRVPSASEPLSAGGGVGRLLNKINQRRVVKYKAKTTFQKKEIVSRPTAEEGRCTKKRHEENMYHFLVHPAG